MLLTTPIRLYFLIDNNYQYQLLVLIVAIPIKDLPILLIFFNMEYSLHCFPIQAHFLSSYTLINHPSNIVVRFAKLNLFLA